MHDNVMTSRRVSRLTNHALHQLHRPSHLLHCLFCPFPRLAIPFFHNIQDITFPRFIFFAAVEQRRQVLNQMPAHPLLAFYTTDAGGATLAVNRLNRFIWRIEFVIGEYRADVRITRIRVELVSTRPLAPETPPHNRN